MTAQPAAPAEAAQHAPRSSFIPSFKPRMRRVWWVTPPGAVLTIVPLSLLIAARIPDVDYREFYRSPRVLDESTIVLFLMGLGALLVGLLLPAVAQPSRPVPGWPAIPNRQLATLRRAEPIAFVLTVLGYLLLGVLGAARGGIPDLVRAATTGNNYTGVLKQAFAPVAGVTSLTQVGIAYVVIAATLLAAAGRTTRLTRRVAIVLFLAVLRAYFLTERLAVLELVVPMVAVWAMWLRQRGRRGAWLPALPAFALPLLLVVFGAFEYSRSWVYFRTRTTLSYPAFVVNRLAGYYATSYNDGALQLAHPQPGRLPYDTIQGLWTAPGIAQLDLYHRLAGTEGPLLLNSVLAQYGNPEFNNPGGLAVPFVDFGFAGGMLYLAGCGLIVGLAYRSWQTGGIVGLLIYPVLFTGLLELPRYVYWTQGRAVPAYIVLLLTAWLMHRAARPAALLVRHVPAGSAPR